MTMTIKPKHFVGLHAHSNFSVGDAIGLPQEHIDFALSNGMDGIALTDHGSMNGISHQQLHVKKLAGKGVNFKAIPGVEAYFIDSLSDWKILLQDQKETKRLEKALASGKTEEAAPEESEDGGTIVEVESETKGTSKFSDPITQRSHLVLLPKNNEGLKSLFRMVSESYISGLYRYPRMDFDILRRHAKGNVIASSACLGGRLSRIVFNHQDQSVPWEDWTVNNSNLEVIQRELKEVSDKFVEVLGGPENFYLELQFNNLGAQHLVNYHLMELAKRTGLKMVVTVDSHYSRPEHWREREIYKAMAWASKTKGTVDPSTLPEDVSQLKCQLYPKNAEQLWDTYLDLKKLHPGVYDDQTICDAIELTHDIAHNQIGSVSIDSKIKLPSLVRIVDKEPLEKLLERSEGMSEDDLAFKELVRLAIEGLRRVGKAKEQEYVSRLRHELETIKELKFSKYFLTYHKIMKVVGDEMLIGNGRGSAAGSLLSYTLNLTQTDPIRFGLVFERFLTKFKKNSFPDIDSDFSDRDRAVQLLIQFFGEENVIPVSNFAQLQLRSLIKDVARLYGLPFEKINAATGKIEAEALAVAKQEPGFDRQVWVLTYEEALKNSETFRNLMEEFPEFQTTIKVLFKQMRGLSRHAGGVIITENSREGMPLIKSGGDLQTPWPEGLNYRHLEEFGLLKFDILGLGTLRMFENCIRRILIKQGNPNPSFAQIKAWFDTNLHPDSNPMTDEKVYKNVFWDSRYTGVFQFVQPNTQEFMRKMKPQSILDIAVATSIFRPGPLGAKVDQKFLRNRTNPENVVYKHPLLKEVFAETSGLLVFQEQLQMIYHKLAGVPLEETDSIRKAFTKKDISNRAKAQADRDALRDKFTELCFATNGISKEISGEVFDEMEKLVSYSFNKSHAVCYAITSWQCAWFLTYYPDEWVATYIDYCSTSKGKVTGKEDPKAIALKEAKGLGYKLAKPDINNSGFDINPHPSLSKTLVPGFSGIAHVGKTATQEILRFRPYRTPLELLVNSDGTWRHSKFNKSALSALIKLEALGSLDCVGPGKLFQNYRQVHEVLIGQYDLLKRTSARKKNNDVGKALLDAIEATKDIPDWTLAEKLEFSKELAGSVDFELIVPADVRSKLDDLGFSSIDDWEEKGNYWAVVSSAELATTKTGKLYLKLKLFAEMNKEYTCFIWGWKGEVGLKPNDVVVALLDRSEFGYSCFQNKIFVVGNS